MILFRVDGNESIGTGHIMRCISIADAAKKKGKESVFVLAGDSSAQLIKEKGYQCEVLNTDFAEMEKELSKFIPVIQRYETDIVFIDSYYVTKRYLQELYEGIKKNVIISVFDDLKQEVFPCDVLVHYAYNGEVAGNEYKEKYAREEIRCPKLLLGEKYAPMRGEFEGVKPRIINREIRNVLMLSGGADTVHITYRFLRRIADTKDVDGYTYHIVIGALCQDRLEIHKLAKQIRNVKLYENCQNMADLMQKCDYAITAGGVTLMELCACGTPMGVYFCADNQLLSEEICNRVGANCLGDARKNSRIVNDIFLTVKEMDEEYEQRVEMSKNQQKLIDGRGAGRIVDQLLNYCVKGD